MKTNPAQDDFAINTLVEEMAKDNKSWYGPTNTCRNYSNQKFENLKWRLGLEETTPPPRSIAPLSPERTVMDAFLAALVLDLVSSSSSR